MKFSADTLKGSSNISNIFKIDFENIIEKIYTYVTYDMYYSDPNFQLSRQCRYQLQRHKMCLELQDRYPVLGARSDSMDRLNSRILTIPNKFDKNGLAP